MSSTTRCTRTGFFCESLGRMKSVHRTRGEGGASSGRDCAFFPFFLKRRLRGEEKKGVSTEGRGRVVQRRMARLGVAALACVHRAQGASFRPGQPGVTQPALSDGLSSRRGVFFITRSLLGALLLRFHVSCTHATHIHTHELSVSNVWGNRVHHSMAQYRA